MSNNIFVLDACALISFLNNENGANKVEELFIGSIQEEFLVYIHAITLYEVYYDHSRSIGEINNAFWYEMLKLPLNVLEELDFNIIRTATYFKTKYRISVADSFVLATAKLHGGTVVTSDHHEFDLIDNDNILDFMWIR